MGSFALRNPLVFAYEQYEMSLFFFFFSFHSFVLLRNSVRGCQGRQEWELGLKEKNCRSTVKALVVNLEKDYSYGQKLNCR